MTAERGTADAAGDNSHRLAEESDCGLNCASSEQTVCNKVQEI